MTGTRRSLRQRSALAGCCLIMAIGLAIAGNGLWIKCKAVLAQVLLERAFAQTLHTHSPVKAWSWADTHPVARIDAPRLKRSSIVLAGASGEAMAFGPGHLAGTPYPGEPGTAVIAAHRDTHFRYLGEMRKGDVLSVTRHDGKTITFEVTATRVVRWDKPDIDLNADGRNLALATCWPIGAVTPGPMRLVVHARIVP